MKNKKRDLISVQVQEVVRPRQVLPVHVETFDKTYRLPTEIADDVSPAANVSLTTPQLAKKLNVSTQWLEIGRCRGYGPPFVRLSPRAIRYFWPDVARWLESRKFQSTSAADQAIAENAGAARRPTDINSF